MKIQYMLTFDIRDERKDPEDFSLDREPNVADMIAWLKTRIGRDQEVTALGEHNWLANLIVTPITQQ